MSMDKHVTNICKTVFPFEKNSKNKRVFINFRYPNFNSCFYYIETGPDNYNSFLYGLPKFLTDRLQTVQSCAAGLVIRSKKYDHVTPLMKQLHWLPISLCIVYKIGLITSKSLNGLGPHLH